MKFVCFVLINFINKSLAYKTGSGDMIDDYWLKEATKTRPSKPAVPNSNKDKIDWENTWVCGDGKVIPITNIVGKKRKLSKKSFTQQMLEACDYSLNRAQCFETTGEWKYKWGWVPYYSIEKKWSDANKLARKGSCSIPDWFADIFTAYDTDIFDPAW